jgi:hypothetical protein
MTTNLESQSPQEDHDTQVAVQQKPSIVPMNAAGEPLPTLTTTVYQQIATQFITHIQELVAQVPGYAEELPAVKARRLVTPEFVGMTLDAIDSSGELQGVRQMDTDEVREMLQLRDAFRPVLSQLAIVSTRLEQLLATREAKAGKAALAIYNIACRLALNANNTHVAVHVERLRAEMRKIRGGRPPKVAKAAAPPAPEGDAKSTG